MKILKKIFISIIIIILILITTAYFWLKSTSPDYSGNISIKGLNDEVEVIFDKYGESVAPGSVLTLSSIFMGPIPVPAPNLQLLPISIIPYLNFPAPS